MFCCALQVFTYHFGLLFLIALSILLAYGLALSLHKANVCKKKYGADFKRVNASASAIKTFNFFVRSSGCNARCPVSMRTHVCMRRVSFF